jgi:hypothetical protein
MAASNINSDAAIRARFSGSVRCAISALFLAKRSADTLDRIVEGFRELPFHNSVLRSDEDVTSCETRYRDEVV